jgi:hypothetical protein
MSCKPSGAAEGELSSDRIGCQEHLSNPVYPSRNMNSRYRESGYSAAMWPQPPQLQLRCCMKVKWSSCYRSVDRYSASPFMLPRRDGSSALLFSSTVTWCFQSTNLIESVVQFKLFSDGIGACVCCSKYPSFCV